MEISRSKLEQEAFPNLKDDIVKMPSFYTPQFVKTFQVYTDASPTAVGECLSQIEKN